MGDKDEMVIESVTLRDPCKKLEIMGSLGL